MTQKQIRIVVAPKPEPGFQMYQDHNGFVLYGYTDDAGSDRFFRVKPNSAEVTLAGTVAIDPNWLFASDQMIEDYPHYFTYPHVLTIYF
jgi:hypothetical protein